MIVSIVMAVYNGEEFLIEAINSALSQTYPHIELIVVNDGSTDSTRAILDDITDQRLKVIHLQQNQGGANALNLGVQYAKGMWIAIHDADDISYPTKIEEQVKYITTHPHIVGLGTLVDFIPGSQDVSESYIKWLSKVSNSVVSEDQISLSRYYICHLTHSSVMFSKDVFLEVGGYNPGFRILYDYDLWLRLLEIGEMAKIPKFLLKYRVHKGSLSRKNNIDTLNEIQTASSRAICRYLARNNQKDEPRVIVIGHQKACENYSQHIAPASGLKVINLIYENWNKQIPAAIQSIKENKVDGIIMLGRSIRKRFISKFKRHGCFANKHIFSIYSI